MRYILRGISEMRYIKCCEEVYHVMCGLERNQQQNLYQSEVLTKIQQLVEFSLNGLKLSDDKQHHLQGQIKLQIIDGV